LKIEGEDEELYFAISKTMADVWHCYSNAISQQKTTMLGRLEKVGVVFCLVIT